MTYTLMQMFRRYAYIGCKNEKVKIGEKKVSLDFCKLLPKEFWEERKKFFFETVVQDIFKPNLQVQVVYSRQLCVSLL